jgi:hypothetical protein
LLSIKSEKIEIETDFHIFKKSLKMRSNFICAFICFHFKRHRTRQHVGELWMIEMSPSRIYFFHILYNVDDIHGAALCTALTMKWKYCFLCFQHFFSPARWSVRDYYFFLYANLENFFSFLRTKISIHKRRDCLSAEEFLHNTRLNTHWNAIWESPRIFFCRQDTMQHSRRL